MSIQFFRQVGWRGVALGCLLTLPLSLNAPAALAQSDDAQSDDTRSRAIAMFKEAEKAFDGGQYDTALKGYEAAYAVHPIPQILYMVARSHELNRNYRQALDVYRKVRNHEGVTADIRGRAADGIIKLEELFPSTFKLDINYGPPKAVVRINGKPTGSSGQARAVLKSGTRPV